MAHDTVGEFDTNSFECRTVHVVFDPVGRNYGVGYGCVGSRDGAFEGWTDTDWGRPLTAKHAHRRVRSYDTHLRCFAAKIVCAHAIEVHAKERGIW